MKKISAHTSGVVCGVLFGVWHTAWAILVMAGLAAPILDWVYGLHFLSNPFKIMPFNIVTAVTLVIFTTIVGYVIGWVSAVIWNSLKK